MSDVLEVYYVHGIELCGGVIWGRYCVKVYYVG